MMMEWLNASLQLWGFSTPNSYPYGTPWEHRAVEIANEGGQKILSFHYIDKINLQTTGERRRRCAAYCVKFDCGDIHRRQIGQIYISRTSEIFLELEEFMTKLN